jgi:hypothetical protein
VVSDEDKEVSQWKVRPPKSGSVWKVVKMKKGEWCEFEV